MADVVCLSSKVPASMMKVSKKIVGEDNEELIIIFPHWHSHRFYYHLISKRLSQKYCVVTYHYSHDILTSDVGKTLINFESVVNDAIDIIKKLNKKKVTIIGFSIGSFVSFMLAKKIQVHKIFIITTSASFAEFVWNGSKTAYIKRRLEKDGVTLDSLNEHWKMLAPLNELKKIKSGVFLTFGKHDRVIPYSSSEKLLESLDGLGIRYDLEFNGNLSHPLILTKYLFSKRLIDKLK